MITLKSFGFKYGRPESNFVFDVSYLPNPWRDKDIRECKDKATQTKMIWKFVNKDDRFLSIANGIGNCISRYYKAFPNENLVVGICCSAGEYRSPIIVELVQKALRDSHIDSKIEQSKNSKL